MESACQVKGCKVSKKVSKNYNVYDDARVQKENNNLNCSDDENNENVKKNLNSKKQASKAISTTTTINNNNNSMSNKNVSSNKHKVTTTSDVGYNQIVSGNRSSAGAISSFNNTQELHSYSGPSYNKVVSGTYKTATANLPYNKVVSNGKTVLDDSTYDRIIADTKTTMPVAPITTMTTASLAMPATTTSNNVLSYNQVVINSYSKPETSTTSYLSYNKAVSSGYRSSSSDEGSNNRSNGGVSYDVVKQQYRVNDETPKMQPQPQPQSQSQKQLRSVTTTTTTTTTTATIPAMPATPAMPAIPATPTIPTIPTNNTQKTINSDAEQRQAVLSYEQVCRLNDVMNEVVSIHGRGNFPTLEVRLCDLVTVVRGKLEEDPANGGAGIKVRDIRLNGGAASHVLATESQPYNDLDLIFGLELSSSRHYDKVKAAVLSSLFDLLPEGVSRKRITTCSLKDAYVSKMVKVNNDGDRWSLISLGNSRGHRNVELKFVDTMRRQFEFSVDSFQIILDSLLEFHAQQQQQQLQSITLIPVDESTGMMTTTIAMTDMTTISTMTTPAAEISEDNYPMVVGESVYGDFHEALYHLQKKLISTRHPEEIRGGGLLKYCNLLVKMYKAAQPEYIKTLERYMCSRFFIDFPDISQQKTKLENYLWNHFVGPEEETLKYQYLTLLHNVVEESTVCLMGHERRQTLNLIEYLAFEVLCQSQQRLNSHQAPPPTYVYANGYYYAPVIPTACYTCTCNSWMACSS